MTEQLDESADGREIELEIGQEFEIKLGENASTGFRWQTVGGSAPECQLVADEFSAPTENQPGRGGSHTWQFRAARAGQCQIELAYNRAGREGSTAGRTFTLRVRVTK
jgi:inhibitor of cysteine peptidase